MGALLVRLGSTDVGLLESFDDESQRFSFDERYVAAFRTDRPILGQIFEDRFPNAMYVGGPICWFAHLLPQGVMRRWRCRLLNLDEDDAFGLLAALGSDLPGAVILTPASSRLHDHPSDKRTPPREEPAGTTDSVLRFSLAGAQWKLSARSLGRGLTTRATAGGTACIAKFHAPEFAGLPRCEFATMNWARAAGLVVPPCALHNVADFDAIPDELPIGDGSVFVIDRFDRCVGGQERLHMEDFGQILDRPPGDRQYDGSYEEIAAVLHWIAPESAGEFVRLLVFNVLCGNGDAHLKNFSILYRQPRTPELSPAYDLVSTIQYCPPGKETLALSLQGSREFAAVSVASFDRVLAVLGLGRADGQRLISDAVVATREAWQRSEVRSEFTTMQAERIDDHLRAVPLCGRS